jgi:hypothetical protein
MQKLNTIRGGSVSRDALLARFMTAVERRDTAALRAMTIDAAELTMQERAARGSGESLLGRMHGQVVADRGCAEPGSHLR